jgi:membrane protein YqaA with SNARE-associated domain
MENNSELDFEKESKWYKSKTQNIFAISSLASCFILLLLLFFIEIPTSNKDVFNILTGAFFGNIIGSVTGYLFGKSKPEGEGVSTSITKTVSENA